MTSYKRQAPKPPPPSPPGIIFLIVNYAHIVATLQTADASASAALSTAPTAPRTSEPGAAPAPHHRTSLPGAAPSAASSVSGDGGGGGSGAGIGRTGATALKDCHDQLLNCTGLYVEDQLSRHFPILVGGG